MYDEGNVLKSRDGIPSPMRVPPGVDLAQQARIARARFYPVTVAYTAYALVILTLGLLRGGRTAILSIFAGAAGWTFVEYLVHRHILHGPFPDGPGWLARGLHHVFDSAHGDHHLRPWDGRHINGRFDTVPFVIVLALLSFLAPLPTAPVFLATVLQCYVLEEWIHYSVHFHHFRWRYFRYIRRHHLYHHSARGRDMAFGLSSGIWDVPLGTRIPRADRERLHRRPRLAGPGDGALAPPVVEGGPVNNDLDYLEGGISGPQRAG
jgi:sterol desaturase/sphingolipid hydroxylase (fatty acid hydroxylase superfamily)